jgi:outer membrane protein assembly factor BamE (lipoprotein component of BamABCDE complex)
LLTALCGCSIVQTPRTLRGNRVDPDALKELVIGTSTKKDAGSLLGSPTAHATFDDNEWIYISETTHTRIGQMPGILKQNVVVLDFDPNGTLRGVKRLNEDDGRNISVVSRATPSPGSDASFLQQLLGNVGKYNVGGLGAGSGDNAPGGGIGSSRGSGSSP